MPHKPEFVGIRVGLPAAGPPRRYPEYHRKIVLDEDIGGLRGVRKKSVDLGAFHHVAELAPPRPNAHQQNGNTESHKRNLTAPSHSSSDNSLPVHGSRTKLPASTSYK